MINVIARNTLILLLSIVFSVALMFAFTELPVMIENFLQNQIGFPAFDQGQAGANQYKTDVYITALHLRWIGYGSLIIIIILISIGFLTRKTGWIWAGSLGLFLPVFGQFALSMFFLSGLGILRVTWFPFMDISPKILELGNIIYLPYEFLMWFFSLFGYYAHSWISWFFMGTSCFIFIRGVISWIQTYYNKETVAKSALYKYSRHPQYLGWILWSYGIMLYSEPLNNMKRSWSFSASLSWLLATMIIIGICMLEELKMRKIAGSEYDAYRAETPFLIPMPTWLVKIFNFPVKIISGSEFPQSGKHITAVLLIYTFTFITLSFARVDFNHQIYKNSGSSPDHSTTTLDTLMKQIQQDPLNRRYVYHKFEQLEKFGSTNAAIYLKMLDDSSEVIREFAADRLAAHPLPKAENALINTIMDPVGKVRNSAAIALAKIADDHTADRLIRLYHNHTDPDTLSALSNALHHICTEKAWDIYIIGLQDERWYRRTAVLTTLYNTNAKKAWPYIYQSLTDEDVNVRRTAVTLILMGLPSDAPGHLEHILDDCDFEIRFFAREAIKRIESGYASNTADEK